MVIGQNVIDSHPGHIVKPMPVGCTGSRVAKSASGFAEGIGESLPGLAINVADCGRVEIADNQLGPLRAMTVDVGSALKRFVRAATAYICRRTRDRCRREPTTPTMARTRSGRS